MYGSIEEEKGSDAQSVPMVAYNDGSHQVQIEQPFDPSNPFDECFDSNFWKEVKDLYNGWNSKISRAKAQRVIRTRKIKENLGGKADAFVYLLTIIHDRYKDYVEQNKKQEIFSTFLFEITEFSAVLLEEDDEIAEPTYGSLIELADGSMKTILHLAAERNLLHVCENILRNHPGLVYVTTLDDEYPLDFALNNLHDDVAALLVQSMENGRVRELFEDSGLEEARFKFKNYIKHGNMKKTVLAILDCLMNPDWPFIPVNTEEDESEEAAAASIPNMPIRYHFYYRLLDGDDEGRPAKEENGDINSEFKYLSTSCLQLIANSCSKEDAIRHPVVRLLVRRKWDAYGHGYMKGLFLQYVIFLALMSLAFFLHTKTNSPLTYESKTDHFRMFCEVMTLVFTFVYFLSECSQVIKERLSYFKDPFNYFDIIGMVLLIALVPLRLTESTKAEWAVSAAAFLINFLRIFKYFPAFRTLGLYTKTFAKIIYYDISKFALIFFVVMFAFTGSVYMALKASNGLSQVGGFWTVLLQEVRALAEAQGFADDYASFNTFVIIFLMVNMFCIMVVLMNILIGQISYRYEEALSNAVIQYDIDKTKLVTKLESSWFKTMNMRIKHYVDGDYVKEEQIENDLLEDWVSLKNASQKDDKKAVKLMMTRRLKKLNPKTGVSLQKIEETD